MFTKLEESKRFPHPDLRSGINSCHRHRVVEMRHCRFLNKSALLLRFVLVTCYFQSPETSQMCNKSNLLNEEINLLKYLHFMEVL